MKNTPSKYILHKLISNADKNNSRIIIPQLNLPHGITYVYNLKIPCQIIVKSDQKRQFSKNCFGGYNSMTLPARHCTMRAHYNTISSYRVLKG